MRKLDKTWVTEDEGYDPARSIARAVERELDRLKIDSYNQQYVIRITADLIDDCNTDDAEE